MNDMPDNQKMRIYDKVLKKYITTDNYKEFQDSLIFGETEDYEGTEIYHTTEMFPVSYIGNAFFSLFDLYLMFPNRFMPPEKCTGLKDKNGKLVFEGDIIKITRGEKPKMFNIPQMQITDVYYDKGAFRYRWDDGSGSVLDFNSFKIVKGYESVTQDVEVIGNIHQNSELLEKGGK